MPKPKHKPWPPDPTQMASGKPGTVQFNERVGATRGRIHTVTPVALARKLLVALWKNVTTGLVLEGARLKAV